MPNDKQEVHAEQRGWRMKARLAILLAPSILMSIVIFTWPQHPTFAVLLAPSILMSIVILPWLKTARLAILLAPSILMSILILVWLVLAYKPSYSSLAEAERGSIKQLAKDITRMPSRPVVTIAFYVRECWTNPNSPTVCGEVLRDIIYDRKSKVIGYEADPGSGYSAYWECDSDERIQAVAAKNGTLSDIGKQLGR